MKNTVDFIRLESDSSWQSVESKRLEKVCNSSRPKKWLPKHISSDSDSRGLWLDLTRRLDVLQSGFCYLSFQIVIVMWLPIRCDSATSLIKCSKKRLFSIGSFEIQLRKLPPQCPLSSVTFVFAVQSKHSIS